MATASSGKTSREYSNNFPDFDERSHSQILNSSSSQIRIEETFESRIHKQIKNLLGRLEVEYHIDWDDPSVYTGTSGVALLYFHLYMHYDVDSKAKEVYLTKAVEIMKKTLKNIKNRAISFICGDAGPYCVGAVVFRAAKLYSESDKCLKKFMQMYEKLDDESDNPDEILFGKSGFLYALLFLRKYFDTELIKDFMISKITKMILRSGRDLGKSEDGHPPLMFQWHNKKYLGAAHGVTGILYLLMCVKDDPYVAKYLYESIRPTIDHLISLKYPSGNFPSSIGSSTDDRLVQWCHGAPGWTYMLLMAYKVFSDQKYLKVAKECSRVIWQRGLLKKGYGLCHGVAGNAYSFLGMYNVTNNTKYLYQATRFAEWCLDYGKHGSRTPDRPYSLFEGMSGTIYFLVDLLKPTEAKFPAFEL